MVNRVNRAIDAFARVAQHVPTWIATLAFAWAFMMALQALPFLAPGWFE